jgi:hypothetical protein
MFSSKRRQRRLAAVQKSHTPDVPDGGDGRPAIGVAVTRIGSERGRVRANPAIRDWTLEPTGRAPYPPKAA